MHAKCEAEHANSLLRERSFSVPKKAVMENRSPLYANENEDSMKAGNESSPELPIQRARLARGKRKATDHSRLFPLFDGGDPMSTAHVSSHQEGIEKLSTEQQEAKVRGENELRAQKQPTKEIPSNWTRDEWVKATCMLSNLIDEISESDCIEDLGIEDQHKSKFQLTREFCNYFKSNATIMRALKERDSIGYNSSRKTTLKGREYPSLYNLLRHDSNSIEDNGLLPYMRFLHQSLHHLQFVQDHLSLVEKSLDKLSNLSQAEILSKTITALPPDLGQDDIEKNRMSATNIIPGTKKDMTTHTNPILQDIALNDFEDGAIKQALEGFNKSFQNYVDKALTHSQIVRPNKSKKESYLSEKKW
jgi:hypothetical protein